MVLNKVVCFSLSKGGDLLMLWVEYSENLNNATSQKKLVKSHEKFILFWEKNFKCSDACQAFRRSAK